MTLYRGTDTEHRRGMSWTTDPGVAWGFAQRLCWSEVGKVWTAEVDAVWLLAEITDRRESEYVVNPTGLTAVTEYVPTRLAAG